MISVSPKWLPFLRIAGVLLALYVALVVLIYFRQRSLLFFPTHHAVSHALHPWQDGDRTIGFCREVPHPAAIWLMMHGNGGEASGRDYVLQCLSDKDSLYVLEYPGYGHREGSPSRESINQAASEAYELLRARNPGAAVCVLGESLGSGPACALAAEKIPPDKIVLVVPFDNLASVAAAHFFYLPVRLMLRDAWDNVAALKNYAGPVDIFGAEHDSVIPIAHARALASRVPQAHFVSIIGEHGEWPHGGKVKISR